ncbi:glycosyltransferase [Pontibacter ruber]|uniref:Glycosyltransferase n=1 Tax=Pontibacter ruber TaxID=1343895 RepID=A0ABW5CZX1_9BACT|nr:glycosyltransferase [Pontibacter ruber]
MRLGISVIVCTYNGASLLPPTIRHIAQQQVRPEINWEFIVVDNASTDNTAKVAQAEWDKYKNPVSFSLLYQPKQGLSYARELALEKSKYEFVLFCDDDNWLNPDYINIAYDLMLQQPLIGVLGGYGSLVFESPPPKWAEGLTSFASGPQGKSSGKVKHNYVYGAGFILRKAAYNSIAKAGFRPMLTDRIANCLSAGGDYELCYAIALAGYDIWYEEKLRFKHFMPEKRITWEYCVRLYKEGAQSLDVLIPYRIRVSMGGKSNLSFHLKYLKTFLTYIRKLVPLLVQKQWQKPESDEAKLNTLRIIALKARILSFSKYNTMRRNFSRIVDFERTELRPSLQKEKTSFSKEDLSKGKILNKEIFL